MPTFSKPASTYEWIMGLQRSVSYGLITQEEMESMIKSKIKK